MELNGARTLITGATGGIGHAVTAALLDVGAQLTLTGRDRTALEGMAKRPGVLAVQSADLAIESERDALVRRLRTDPGALDLAVLVAGVGRRAPVVEHTAADLERLIGINMVAPIRLIQQLAPLMGVERPARIVLVGSIAGLLGVPAESVYAATKAGLAIFADSIRSELRPAGVGVTMLVPGVVDTDFFAHRGAPYDRRFPPPVPASRVAGALVRGLRRDAEEIVVPGWLRLPLLIRQLAPQTYRRAASRWG